MKHFLFFILWGPLLATAHAGEKSLADYCNYHLSQEEQEELDADIPVPDNPDSWEFNTKIDTINDCREYLATAAKYGAIVEDAGINIDITSGGWQDEDEANEAGDKSAEVHEKRIKSLKSRISALESSLIDKLGLQDIQSKILLLSDKFDEDAKKYILKAEVDLSAGAPKFLIATEDGSEDWYTLGDMIDGEELTRKNKALYIGDVLVPSELE